MSGRKVQFIAVHCSATPAGRDFRAADIDRMHRERGFSSIGYHYVIGLDGKVEDGRPLDEDHILEPHEVGAHVKGFNSVSVGICLIGGIKDGKSANTYTDAQLKALKFLLSELRVQFPSAKIRGHRDFPAVAKDCPCFDVQAWCKASGINPL